MAELNQNRLRITLHVYDEEIEVVVKREEEEYYRAAAKLHIKDVRVIIL